MKVSESFIQQFLNSKEKKHPKQADISQKLSKIQGRWLSEIKFDDRVYYDIVKDLPDKMIDYPSPLSSDARYREDLIYRSRKDLIKSQSYKETLENIQRKDRKLREQYSGKKH